MADRFNELYRLPNNLYSEGSPIIIEAGVLYKDQVSGRILLQLKMRNISDQTITACKVSIRAFEPNGTSLEGVDDFPYFDIHVVKGQNFGSKVPIFLSDDKTRKVTIAVTEALFEDGNIWRSAFTKWDPLPSQKNISAVINDPEIVKQYQLELGSECSYYPGYYAGLFFCACGTVNSDSANTCYYCKRSPNAVIEKLDINNLTILKNQRLEKERKEKLLAKENARIEAENRRLQEERTRKEAERKRIKKKQNVRRAVIITVIVLIVAAPFVIIFGLKAWNKHIKESTYEMANSLMKESKYDEAIELFTELDSFKDSAEKKQDCEKKKVEYEDQLKCDSEISEIKNKNIGDIVHFGNFNGNTEWVVLEKVNDEKMLLLSRYKAEYMEFNTKNEDVNWETCSLRKWLNEEYYNDAFSKYEKEKILFTDAYSRNNYNRLQCFQGREVQDKVLLPITTEVKKIEKMGVADNYNEMWLFHFNYPEKFAQSMYHGLDTYSMRRTHVQTTRCVFPEIWINIKSSNISGSSQSVEDSKPTTSESIEALMGKFKESDTEADGYKLIKQAIDEHYDITKIQTLLDNSKYNNELLETLSLLRDLNQIGDGTNISDLYRRVTKVKNSEIQTDIISTNEFMSFLNMYEGKYEGEISAPIKANRNGEYKIAIKISATIKDGQFFTESMIDDNGNTKSFESDIFCAQKGYSYLDKNTNSKKSLEPGEDGIWVDNFFYRIQR